MKSYEKERLNAEPITYFLVFNDSESARVIFPTFCKSLDSLIEDRFKSDLFPVAFAPEMERLEIYEVPKNLNFTLYNYVDLKLREKPDSILSGFILKYVEELTDNKEFDKSWMMDYDFQKKWKE